MYFKQLELFGFKSFAQKTVLQLEPGVSAVVGPNGCGKSNIGDAVRWALGEQKMRVLRGQQMDDVIFNGSDDRHPLGMAEVTLILDNADKKLPLEYSEVSLTRRLFRSGESEYYINKLPCRRKDVVELLMGSGIGADSYSLIEQGRVDLVLSSKPEERRYIFEDAAGIIKYKSRKDAALRKLERTDTNLLRLQDTIIEVRRQINSLKRQVNAAQRYRQAREELRAIELRLALVKYRQLDSERSQLLDKAKNLGGQLSEVSGRQAEEEARINSTRSELIELEKTLSAANQQAGSYQSAIERSENQVALLKEKIAGLTDLQTRSSHESEELELLNQNLAALCQLTGNKEREASQQAAQATELLNLREATLVQLNDQIKECESQLEKMRSLSLEKLNRKVNLQNELRTAEINLQEFEKKKAKLLDQKNQVEQNLSDCQRRLSETRNLTNSLRAALGSLSSDIESLTNSLAVKQRELDDSIVRFNSARESLSAARSKQSSLEELRDKFEGYDDGVRAVMMAKQQGDTRADGVIGTLAELFQGRREHEAALEAALGHRLQHIVVKDVETARKCAGLLEAEKTGRASFIPLSLFSANGHVKEPLNPGNGAVGWASNLIMCTEALRPLAENLLGQVLVVDTTERAFSSVSSHEAHLLPSNGDARNGEWLGCDLVTLEGDAISSVGIISSGSRSQARGLLGRKNEIEELRQLVEKYSAEVETGGQRISHLREELENMRVRLQELHAALNSRKVELAGAESNERQLNEGTQRLEQEQRVLTQEHSFTEKEIFELSQHKQEVAQQVEFAHHAEAEITGRLQGATEVLAGLKTQKEKATAEVTDSKVTVSSLQLNCQSFKRETDRLKSEMEETNRKIQDKRKQLSEARETCERLSGEIETIRLEIGRNFEQKRILDADIHKLQEQKVQIQNVLNEVENAVLHTRHLAQELGDQHHQAEIHLTQVSEKISHLKERTVTEYHLSISEVAEQIPLEDTFDPDAATEQSQQLRAKIESMGPVNLIAIEEFEELQHRYDFLIQQETDLRKAKEVLLGIIKQINETTQAMFLESFQQVQTHFSDIFRHLFGGGRASISLIDPSAPLETGIEISVHPPGKKPQNISLLSGGEKALTAIALLFSIFKTKPSPFCMLDEVDAPLDDTNILRFARLVKLFSQDVQFILVTHNKHSMELADVLYGITMEERGVSQIVSVKLKKPSTAVFEFLEPTPAQ